MAKREKVTLADIEQYKKAMGKAKVSTKVQSLCMSAWKWPHIEIDGESFTEQEIAARDKDGLIGIKNGLKCYVI